MAAVIPAPWLLAIAMWMGCAALGLSLLLLGQIFFMRRLLTSRERRRQELRAVWRPVILDSLIRLPVPLPELAPADFAAFALLWNHFHEVLDGVSRERLNALGDALGLGDLALARLGGSSGEEQLMAILTLGHLREERAWHQLEALALQPVPLLSITAARALVLVDAAAAMALFARLIEQRDDWPLASVGAILREAGPQAVTLPLIGLVAGAAGHREVRLIRLLEYAQGRLAMPMIRAISRRSCDPEVLAVCLHLVRDRRDAIMARRFLRAGDWRVRVQAVLALGRVGGADDRAALVERLQDSQWWVRYRAAQALLELPEASRESLAGILARQTDPFARDILGQVMAERYAS